MVWSGLDSRGNVRSDEKDTRTPPKLVAALLLLLFLLAPRAEIDRAENLFGLYRKYKKGTSLSKS